MGKSVEGNVPAPSDGSIPDSILEPVVYNGSTILPMAAQNTLSFYVHVPFCAARCGYCDFNTYTAVELGNNATQATYSFYAQQEIELASQILHTQDSVPPIHSIFFGGGTPTLLPSEHLVGILGTLKENFALSDDIEITVEANPDSVTFESLKTLRDAGFNRISFGMQSAVDHVLETLERTHRPENVEKAVRWARELGFEVSVDLIYGTPGESLADWQTSLETAIDLKPDHVSAYSLIVEEGTKMAAKIKRGLIANIEDDDHADKYILAEKLLSRAGFNWYEISNWKRENREHNFSSNHNKAYWFSGNWWGVGPGAHSHISGVRWWNVKHPAAYTDRFHQGRSPAIGRESLDSVTRINEKIMLEIRTANGLDISPYEFANSAELDVLFNAGYFEAEAYSKKRLILTLEGRLMADWITQKLWDNIIITDRHINAGLDKTVSKTLE